jgi:hypothetical protein
MKTFSFSHMLGGLLRAENQSRTAKTVELFGWLIFVEGPLLLLFPHFAASLLHLPPLVEQGANYLRLVGVLVGGIGMLYVVSARLNAEGFIFASLLDRPLVPPLMAVLWYFGIIPGPLALAFALQDFGSFLWTLFTWRAESRAQLPESSVSLS